MAAQNSAQRGGQFFSGQTLLLASVFLLPGLAPSLFGWTSGLLAIPVFVLLSLYGIGRGTIYIRNGVLIALAGAILIKTVPPVIFSVSLIPLGFSFNRSALGGESEWRTAVRGSLILAASWIVFWALYGAVKGINPYTYLLHVLDSGFAEAYEYYRTSAELPAETLLRIEKAVEELRALIPKILPGLLCCTVILTVWINMVGSIRVIEKIRPGKLPWRQYSRWRLPDNLVWFAIGSGVLLLSDWGGISVAALGVLLVCGLLYFFQGLAVFVHLLETWKVPLYFRIAIYAILILQSYGLLLLIILGLADVWIDFRRHPRNDNKTSSDGSEQRED